MTRRKASVHAQRRRWRTAAGLLTGFGTLYCSGSAGAQPSAAPLPPPARLAVVWDAGGPATGPHTFVEAAFDATTRRSSHATWTGTGPERSLVAAQYQDGKTQVFADGMMGTYTAAPPVPRPTHTDPVLFDVPWPLLPEWVAVVEAAPDRTEAAHPQGRLQRSEALGLELIQDSQTRVVGFASRIGPDARGAPLWVECGFEDWHDQANTQLPRVMKVVIRSRPTSGVPQWDRSNTYTLVSATTEAQAVERALRFDPVELGVNRMDRATTDVFDERGKLLYNQKERERAALAAVAGTASLQPWLYGGGALVIIAATGLAVRRALGRA